VTVRTGRLERFVFATNPHSPDYLIANSKEHLHAKDNLGDTWKLGALGNFN